ncbi:hypothetical protein K458DRAFT_492827 [Lentithecium fluviatile CBS 122367]|uniref:NADH dehydrogenase [ubiquinone] 1 alpha subcomplex assembly factor 3 n=1 Tax=Lentithecium fluviatile CBS 122367 TaxID=1168545 RepID=A0A6G1ICU8_9PLEO|nr:hypothetical protein K458DRAFT_492827 [Lentithecium fluviatile CBS 122367]
MLSRTTGDAMSASTPAIAATTNPHPANPPRPQLRRNKTSAVHNARMREIIRPWAELASTPPGCRAVSFSSWTRFSSDNRSKSSDELKASVLCAANGTMPDFNPPLLEQVYLGADQPPLPPACRKEEVKVKRIGKQQPQAQSQLHPQQRRETDSTRSWATATSSSSVASASTCSTQEFPEPITFRKKEVKGSLSPPCSLLTASINASPAWSGEPLKPCITEEMAKEFGVMKLSSSHLPETCFDDSDEENDQDEEDKHPVEGLSLSHHIRVIASHFIALRFTMERGMASYSRTISRAFTFAVNRTPRASLHASLHASPASLYTPPAPRIRLFPLPRIAHERTHRCIHTTLRLAHASPPPKSRDRGPKSTEDTQTDFSALDVLRNTAAPATSIDACTDNGFALNNQTRVSGCGVLLVGGEAFRWRPWIRGNGEGGTGVQGAGGNDKMRVTGRLLNQKGQWEVPDGAWGVLDLVFPKPDLLIIGTGPSVVPIAPGVRKYLNGLGIRLEIQDTRNAAAQFNLLATERGVGQVAAAMVPVGWREVM